MRDPNDFVEVAKEIFDIFLKDHGSHLSEAPIKSNGMEPGIYYTDIHTGRLVAVLQHPRKMADYHLLAARFVQKVET